MGSVVVAIDVVSSVDVKVDVVVVSVVDVRIVLDVIFSVVDEAIPETVVIY